VGHSYGLLPTLASIAQGIEHRFPKPCVAGSNPARGTSITAGQSLYLAGCDSSRATSVQYLPSESPGEEPTMSTTITEQRHSITAAIAQLLRDRPRSTHPTTSRRCGWRTISTCWRPSSRVGATR